MASFCPKCGNPRVAAFRYCQKCQFDFDSIAAEPAAAPVQAGAPVPLATPPPRRGGIGFRTVAGVAILGVVAYAALSGGGGTTRPSNTQPTPGRPQPTLQPEPSTSSANQGFTQFAPVNLQGKGDKVAKFTIPAEAPAIAKISYTGSSNFVIESLAADGSTNDLLVNVIGKYKGTVLFDTELDAHSVAFRVTASGSWTIAVQPLTAARTWNGAAKLSGTGDDVIVLSPTSIGLTTVKITHSGSSNFVVIAFSDGGSDLLVNEIGHYSGEQLLSDGTLLLQIEADGAWTVVKT